MIINYTSKTLNKPWYLYTGQHENETKLVFILTAGTFIDL